MFFFSSQKIKRGDPSAFGFRMTKEGKIISFQAIVRNLNNSFLTYTAAKSFFISNQFPFFA